MNTFNTGCLCRTCLRRDGSLQSIFTEISDLSITLAEIINSSVPSAHITKNDGFSDQICACCSQKVIDLHKFMLNIKKNQIILKTGSSNGIGTLTKDFQHLENISNRGLLIKEEICIKKEVDLSIVKVEDLHHEIIIDEYKLKQEEINEIAVKSEDGLLQDKNISEDDSTEGESSTANCYQEEMEFESSPKDDTFSNRNQLEEQTNKNCHKKFKQKDNLNKHSLNKSNNLENHILVRTGEKPFECGICSKRFKHKFNLIMHLMFHSDENAFVCKQCDRTFTKSGNLKTHLLIHSGSKPFECEVCHLSFTQKSSLNRHLKLHSGNNLFECGTCHRTYTRKQYLTRHLMSHSG